MGVVLTWLVLVALWVLFSVRVVLMKLIGMILALR
jgi:hypothetical protein